MRPRMVECCPDVGELLRLGAPGGAGQSGGVGLQGALHARVAAVLVRLTGFDELRQAAQARPPRGSPGQPGQGVGGEWHAVVGAATPRQAECFEHTHEYGVSRRDARRCQGVAAEGKAAVAIGNRQWIAIVAVTGLEVPCEVGTPHLGRCSHGAGGVARMPADAAPVLLGHQAVAAEEVTDGRAGRPRPAGMASAQDRHPLLGAPGGMPTPCVEERRHHIVRRVAGRGAGPTGALFEALRAVGAIAVEPGVSVLRLTP
jgi:hypothetical protein